MSSVTIHRMEQGTDEWKEARLGRATSSRFDMIVTPAARKFSKSAERLAVTLLTEWMLGEPLDDGFWSPWADRGKALEDAARQWYELATANTVERVGFVERNDLLVGASTDGLTGDDEGEGVLEIKVRKAEAHVHAILQAEKDEYAIAPPTQVQGEMWVTGAAWCDTVSYNPHLRPVIRRVYRDPEWMEALDEHVGQRFMALLEEGRDRLYALGAVPEGVVRPQPRLLWQQEIDNKRALGAISAEEADLAVQMIEGGSFAFAREILGAR